MTVNFVDNKGNTSLDYAVVNERFEMVRLLTSMGAQVNSLTVSLSKSHAMEALVQELHEKREAHGESRKRKRDVESTEGARMARSDLPGRILTLKLRNQKSYAKMSQSSMRRTNHWLAHFRRSRQRQPRGSGTRHLVRRKSICARRAFVPGTSRNVACA